MLLFVFFTFKISFIKKKYKTKTVLIPSISILLTLSGAGSMHHTFGIGYQNESQTSREIPKREDTVRKRKIKDITKVLQHEQAQEIEPYRKKPRMSHFRFENVMLYPTHSFIQSASFDTLWTFSFNFLQDIPMWTGWNSERYYEKTPTKKIGHMKPITLPPTRTDVVRETMIQSQKVSAECGSKYTIITYDLAIAKVAKQIQCEEYPTFNSIFVMFGRFQVEQNVFSAIGKIIEGSGGPYILSESGAIATGSLPQFLKGEMYCRCRRIHTLLSAAFYGLHIQ